MFIEGIIIGIIVGSIITLVIHSCIILGRQADEKTSSISHSIK